MTVIIAHDLATAVDNNIQTSLKGLPDFERGVSCNVTWGGGVTAGTSWSVRTDDTGKRKLNSEITMPSLPATATVSRYEADVMTGFAIHEMGHNICTDIDVWKAACREGSTYTNILNSLEDPRMEIELVSKGRFSGAKRMLELLTEYCVRISKDNGWHPSKPECLAFSVNTLAYIEWCGYDVPSAGDILKDAGALAGDIRMWTDKLMLCKTTEDCWLLTQEMVEHYENQKTPELPQIPEPQAAQNQEKPDNNEAQEADTGMSGDDNDAGDDEPNQPPVGQANAADDQPETQDAEDKQPISTKGRGTGDETPSMHNQMNTEKDVSGMAENITDRTDGGKLGLSNVSSTEVLQLQGNTAKNAKRRAREIRSYVPRNVAGARQRITRLLHNPDRRGELRGRKRGKLDTSRLARLATNRDDLFAQRWKKSGYRTAVSLILDNSGSMSGADNRAAVMLGFVFGDAMASANIPFSVSAFPRVDVASNRNFTRDRNLEGYTRDVSLFNGARSHGHHNDYEAVSAWSLSAQSGTVLKSFDVPWSKTDINLTAMWENTTGCTPLVASVLAQIRVLRDRQEAKKVIFVMSDGGADEGMEVLSEATKLANLHGIKVVGLCIGRGNWVNEMADACNAAVIGETCEDILMNLDKLATELE